MNRSYDFADYMYARLPDIYKKYDTKGQLKAFIETLAKEGIEYAFNEILKSQFLNRPEDCPEEYLPYLCANLGIVYSPIIPAKYHRLFLKNFFELNIRKGTVSCIEFLVREMSGYDVTVQQSSQKVFNVDIEAFAEDSQLSVAQDAINSYIQNYIPLGVTVNLSSTYSGYTDDAQFSVNEFGLGDSITSVSSVFAYDGSSNLLKGYDIGRWV